MKQSDYIKKLRGNLTQQEFAEIVGEQRSHVSAYENDKRAISFPKLLEWCVKMDKKLSIL